MDYMTNNMTYDIINNCLVKLVSYKAAYTKTIPSTYEQFEKTEFSFEILKMTIFLVLPETQDIINLEELDSFLLENFVEYSDEMQEKVYIVEYCRRDDVYIQEKDFYIWSIFHYTYEMQGMTEDKKIEFLWVSIIFPYIYKLSKYKRISKKSLRLFNSRYPVLKNWEKNNKDLLTGKINKDFFCNIINNVRGIKRLLPGKVEREAAIEESIQGAIVAKSVLRGEKL